MTANFFSIDNIYILGMHLTEIFKSEPIVHVFIFKNLSIAMSPFLFLLLLRFLLFLK